MAELKTQATHSSVTKFIDRIADKAKREDAYTIVDLMQKATKAEPKMWGSSIIGFGDYRYVYESGRENDWFIVGFAPRKQNLAFYVMGGWQHTPELFAKLGKHSFGKGCLYINRLDDVNIPVLKKLINESVKRAKKQTQANTKK